MLRIKAKSYYHYNYIQLRLVSGLLFKPTVIAFPAAFCQSLVGSGSLEGFCIKVIQPPMRPRNTLHCEIFLATSIFGAVVSIFVLAFRIVNRVSVICSGRENDVIFYTLRRTSQSVDNVRVEDFMYLLREQRQERLEFRTLV